MKTTDILALARKISNTNSSTFTDADALLYIKAVLPQFQSDVEAVNEEYMGSIEYRDLRVTGTGTYVDTDVTYLSREYNLPSDMIPRLKSVSAKLNGVDWINLKNYGKENLEIPFEETNIKANFTNDQGIAGFQIFRGSLFLLTGEIETAVTGGLKIWTYSFTACPTSIPVVGSADDIEFDAYGIPEILHELFAVAMSKRWKSNQDVPVPLTELEQNYYALYADKLNTLKGLDRGAEMIFTRPDDGMDNGFNC